MNSDYEILAKCIANRLIKVLPEIIKEDQNGFIQGRFISYNIRKLEDIIQFCDSHNKSGIILNIDFLKAFDALKWSSIIAAHNSSNFGTYFIELIKLMYNNIETTVINNGNISE